MSQPAPDSLVRYDNPVQTAKTGTAKSKDASKVKTMKASRYKVTSTTDAKQGAASTQTQTEQVLCAILPPRCVGWAWRGAVGSVFPSNPDYACSVWEEDGVQWEQKVSSTPATRNDVIHLQVCALWYDLLLSARRNWMRGCRRARPDPQEFAPSEENYMHSVLVCIP